MVTVPHGTQNPAYSPPSAHCPWFWIRCPRPGSRANRVPPWRFESRCRPTMLVISGGIAPLVSSWSACTPAIPPRFPMTKGSSVSTAG